MIYRIVAVLSFCVCFPAGAGGLVTIAGKLNSITPSLYVIESQQSVFHLKRSAISKDQAKRLAKPNQQVTLAVPFSAIERIQNK